MQGLGYDFNLVAAASGRHVSLENAQGVTFLVFEADAATSINIKESKAGAGAQNLPVINHYYASTGLGGVWTRMTTDNGGAIENEHTIVKIDGVNDAVAIYVDAESLSDGFTHVECTVDGSAICQAVVHGLKVQRDPANLPAAAVAEV